MSDLYTDDEVASAIIRIIREAKDHVFLVSPYNKLWTHVQDAIRLAVKRGVKITVLYREDEPSESIDWFRDQGALLYSVERLHAKIYFNESTLLMTSMNLLETSSKNSKEIAIRVADQATQREIRDYVLNRLIPLATAIGKPKQSNKWHQLAAAASHKPKTETRQPTRRTQSRSKPSKPAAPTGIGGVLARAVRSLVGGQCIRCGEGIAYDVDRPLCDKCYAVWNRYSDPDYPEDFCHRCGDEAHTSYAKPLCLSCYGAVTA